MTISKQGATLRLSGPADLRDAAGLHTALLDCLESREATVVDAGGLEAADVPALQLIEAARRAFAEAGVPLKVENGQGGVARAWTAAGMPAPAGEERR